MWLRNNSCDTFVMMIKNSRPPHYYVRLKATDPTAQCTNACRWYLDHLPPPDPINDTSTNKSGNEISVTCMARRRLLTNTLLNLVSLRYLPTASPCLTPVSDSSVSTPCPEIQMISSIVNGPAKQDKPLEPGTEKTYLAAACLCCTASPHCKKTNNNKQNHLN